MFYKKIISQVEFCVNRNVVLLVRNDESNAVGAGREQYGEIVKL